MPGDSLQVNTKIQQQNQYDAIVIGSGISGGWAAKELTEKGFRVLMLERGRNFEHIKDYKTAPLSPWELPHRGTATAEQKRTHPVIARGWALSGPVMDYWTNEEDCP
jgi:choline dehydrogenase-like flavoprotein